MKKVYVFLSLMLCLIVFNSNAQNFNKCYIFGNMTGWDNKEQLELPKIADNVYCRVVKFDPGAGENCYFKVKRGNIECGAFNEADYELQVGNPYVFKENGDFTKAWYVKTGKEYLVIADFSNNNGDYSIEIKDVPQNCYLMGNINNIYSWNPIGLLALSKVDGASVKFQGIVEFKKGDEFCVTTIEGSSNEDWETVNNNRFGGPVENVEGKDEPTIFVQEGGFDLSKDYQGKWGVNKVGLGAYVVSVDFNLMKIDLKNPQVLIEFENGETKPIAYNTTAKDVSGLVKQGQRFRIKETNTGYIYGCEGPLLNESRINLIENWSNDLWMTAPFDIKNIAFKYYVGKPVLYISSNDTPTSVESVTEDTEILAGEGTIDVAGEGNDVKVYSINGVLVSEGQNHVELEAGIYIVKTGNTVKKVIVK